jgi:hypothetical protein
VTTEQPARTLTYRDLVARLTDVRRLATPPVAGETAGTFTSYDRASTFDAATRTYQDWGANADGTGYLREHESGGLTVFDADGPGVIWRIWSALPADGHLRIYIDGASEPVFDRPFRDLFERFGDERSPANFPDLMPTLSRGRNCWIPLAYQRHCTIVLDEGWGAYYHLSHSTFPADWTVPSFDGTFSSDDAIALAEADRALSLRGKRRPEPSADRVDADVRVEPGTVRVVAGQDGAGAVTDLRLRVPGLAALSVADEQKALRLLTIRITWDGDETPAVWAPLGDFFGSAPGVQPYDTLVLGAGRHEFRSSWFMPFARGMRIEIGNDDTIAHDVTAAVETCDLDAGAADGMLRFHARWHRGEFGDLDRSRFDTGGDRWPDWPLLLTQGSGRFCGAHLHVYDAWVKPAEKPETWWYGRWDRKTIDWWWGEGDEKFFVDGEDFPSTFGTGSEDWVGYAWAAEPPFPMFDSAFAAQPFVELDANGHTSVSRFHIADDVPFTSSFAGFLEKYKDDVWDATNACLYAATVYWYGESGSGGTYREYTADERWGFYQLP